MRTLTAIAMALLVLTGCLLTGCNEWAIIRPTTELKVNPWTKTFTYRNTKDVDSKLTGLDIVYASTQPTDGPPTAYASVHIQSWDVTDNSSPVVEQNVKQMEVAVKQMEQTNEMIKSATAGIANIASSLTPIVGQLSQMAIQVQALKNSSLGGDLRSMIGDAVKEGIRKELESRGDAGSQ